MPVSPDERLLLDLLRAGDERAAQQLFETYVHRLLPLARQRLGARVAARDDPEDVVQSVFRTFFCRVKDGRFELGQEDDLGNLLMGITVRKALRRVAFHQAAKRDPRREVVPDPSEKRDPLEEAAAQEPSPEAEVAFQEELDRFLNRLRPQDRRILEMRLQGHSSEEIAQAVGTYDRHVRRVLEHIRTLLTREQQAP